ncbi:hypothetical protein ACWCQ1_21970 [Streptomyces sp. NPDC002144]|uniref:hypothetical protein n=1 Tax=Streptomyces sp. NPDC006668 TaxID=3156903 RepID=UPI0010542229
MHRTRTTTAGLLAAVTLTACGSQATHTTTPDARHPAGTSASLTARAAFEQISRVVRTANMTGTVTAANDPNQLLGRPDEYTSKVTFSDSFVPANAVTGAAPGDVERGGAVEVFTDPAAAKARADHIQGVTRSTPALAEYDYVHGRVLVRVSRYVPPARAAAYRAAVDRLF